MEKIIDPISVEFLKAELTPARKLRDTNKGGNEIYLINGKEAPNVLQEIGRLREEAFRKEGGGSGLAADLDIFDTMDVPYMQLVVWDPEAEAILGGYRYILGPDIQFGENGQPILATSHMFHFSQRFIEEYLPYTMELGRSFVSPDYQSSKAGSKALYALDNLWDGIAAIMIEKPGIRYFFGKMTMYPTFDRLGRDMILYFLKKYFQDKELLVSPYKAMPFEHAETQLSEIFVENDFKGDYKILNNKVRELGYTIPPLFNSYMKLSSTMKLFGTAVNDEFSDVEETGILIDFEEMYEEKRQRHTISFLKSKITAMRRRFPFVQWLKDDQALKLLEDKVRSRRILGHDRIKQHRSITKVLDIK